MHSSKEIVLNTLNFENKERAPRQLWVLPWARIYYKEELCRIEKKFEWDIVGTSPQFKEKSKTEGNPYEIGTYIDEWGCIFENKQKGIIGEVKHPIVTDEEWEDTSKIHIPYEQLSFDIEDVNSQCLAKKDKFILGGCCPRPFEQLQFIRGTENLYMDLILKPEGLFEFIKKMHVFYCELMEKWAQTDVDGLMMMDDWGSQNSLLINPALWDEIFRPMYQDYIDIAHRKNKKIFMHSDGYTLDIYPRLIEMGLDAFNSQIFCMGIDKLEEFKGKITFWGEMDRQDLLVNATPNEIKNKVKYIKEKLWVNGGCIAQCEFGPGAKPENVRAVFEGWDEAIK